MCEHRTVGEEKRIETVWPINRHRRAVHGEGLPVVIGVRFGNRHRVAERHGLRTPRPRSPCHHKQERREGAREPRRAIHRRPGWFHRIWFRRVPPLLADRTCKAAGKSIQAGKRYGCAKGCRFSGARKDSLPLRRQSVTRPCAICAATFPRARCVLTARG